MRQRLVPVSALDAKARDGSVPRFSIGVGACESGEPFAQEMFQALCAGTPKNVSGAGVQIAERWHRH